MLLRVAHTSARFVGSHAARRHALRLSPAKAAPTFSTMPRDVYDYWIAKLRYFHGHLRADLKALLKESERMSASIAPKATETASLARNIARYLNSLDSHHSVEDRYFIPLLARRIDTSKLTADHGELEELIEDLRRDMRSGKGADVRSLHAGLVKLEAHMLPHLEFEESLQTASALKAAGFTVQELSII